MGGLPSGRVRSDGNRTCRNSPRNRGCGGWQANPGMFCEFAASGSATRTPIWVLGESADGARCSAPGVRFSSAHHPGTYDTVRPGVSYHLDSEANSHDFHSITHISVSYIS